MQVDLDRTQEWLNRTQAIRRTPAVRGGVIRDTRTMRQTLAFVLTGLLLILVVFLIPRPSLEEPKRIVSPEFLPALTDLPRHVALPAPQPLPALPFQMAYTKARLSSNVLNEPRIWHYPPRTDRIAPHAPIWIVSEPVTWTPPVASTPTPPSQHLPPSGISVLSR